jgi:hypothetical protein
MGVLCLRSAGSDRYEDRDLLVLVVEGGAVTTKWLLRRAITDRAIEFEPRLMTWAKEAGVLGIVTDIAALMSAFDIDGDERPHRLANDQQVLLEIIDLEMIDASYLVKLRCIDKQDRDLAKLSILTGARSGLRRRDPAQVKSGDSYQES